MDVHVHSFNRALQAPPAGRPTVVPQVRVRARPSERPRQQSSPTGLPDARMRRRDALRQFPRPRPDPPWPTGGSARP
eukprot:4385157-Prymnesium_polylepis.1